MADIHSHDDRGKKRKKKRSYMQMAKKFARRRNHGTDLDTETYQYMVRVLELMREDFPSVEEKLIFINNVYEQSVGHEIEYVRNQVGSRVLESLLKYASLETLQRFTNALSSSLRPISSDRFGSHVLEKIIVVCADRGNRSKNVSEKPKSKEIENMQDITIDVKESEVKLYNDIVIKLCKYLINNLEEFVWDTYANHLLRTVIECLGGLIDTSDGQNRTKQVLASIKRQEVIQEYKDILIDACNRLYKWPQFLEFGKDELTSGLLQSVLYSLKDIDKKLTKNFIKKITSECFSPGEDEKLSHIFDCESSTRLLEVSLAVAKSKSFNHIYEQYFKGKMKYLCTTQGSNFSVQKLLDHCDTKETFEEIFEEVEVLFPDILRGGYTGILTSIANASKRLQTKQGAFVTAIIKTLECNTSEEKQYQIIKCISTLKKQSELESLKEEEQTKLPVHLHGSLIIQAVLNFNKPIKIVNSLLAMDNEQLLDLISNPKGSHIIDAFMDSKYIGEKSREKLARKLQGCWAQLAQSTHGSRCLDKIWVWARQKQRLFMMEELAAAGESLRGSKSGLIISNKLNVSLFARNKKDWTESQGKEEKVKALFADIIQKPVGQS
ncbi:hypothetical protein KPH14_001303 [Odynerus spinipes]|uniref:Nucleolar protein 9 n=1 Tax=Odynerus spinipes TaxID=1348599 RepID=A0AAD9RGB3_9HYME|nr:hypothetical protein KPH14_001303 [Odynerus spinipes]